MEGERFMKELEKKLERVTEGSEQKEVMSLKAKLKYTYNNEKKHQRHFQTIINGNYLVNSLLESLPSCETFHWEAVFNI